MVNEQASRSRPHTYPAGGSGSHPSGRLLVDHHDDLRERFEGLSAATTLSQFAGLLAGACGRAVDATVGVSMGNPLQVREAVCACEDAAGLALELARVLREDGLA